jgi:hypothetical protein
LSTTVCCPQLSVSRWLTMRVTMSIALPAVFGTTMRTGREG